MENYDLERQNQKEAASKTMRVVDPDRAEATIKEYFNAGSSTWTDWDEQFITFIEENRQLGLLYGSVGDGWHFLISPSVGKGF